MRLTFLLLVLLNLAVFIWGAGYLGSRDPGREPERLGTEQHADKLRVLPANVPMSCQHVDGLDAAQHDLLREHFSGARDVEIVSSENTNAPTYWLAISNLDSAELATRKQGELRRFNVTDAQVLADSTHGPFVVLIASLNSEEAAQKQLSELNARGIRSARVITREAPPSTFRVSLHWPESVDAQHTKALAHLLADLSTSAALHYAPCPESAAKQ